MMRSRIALFCIGLVLLGVLVVVGGGIYLSQNLPQLLRLHAARVLQHYGVDDIAFEGLHISHTTASVDSLQLRGSYNNLRYQASVGSGALHYNWRGLLTGTVDSVALSSLDVSIVQTAAHDDPEQRYPRRRRVPAPAVARATSLSVAAYRPAAGQLPVR
jgi:hypothetical protein